MSEQLYEALYEYAMEGGLEGVAEVLEWADEVGMEGVLEELVGEGLISESDLAEAEEVVVAVLEAIAELIE